VDYKEFVDVLARDTVAPAALGKRDMQASDAMGVDEFAKVKTKNVKPTLNRHLASEPSGPEPDDWTSAAAMAEGGAVDQTLERAGTSPMASPGVLRLQAQKEANAPLASSESLTRISPPPVVLKPMVLKHDLGPTTDQPASLQDLKSYMSRLRNSIETKYKLMRSAFRAIDEDKSGCLGVSEIIDAVKHFALPIPLSHIHEIFDKIDTNNDGSVSFNEFIDAIKNMDDRWLETEQKTQQARLQ